jgi:hypothetical protein
MTKEALRLALGALQRFIKYDYNETPFDGKDVEGAEAITAIKEALAQPEQEPVAWRAWVSKFPQGTGSDWVYVTKPIMKDSIHNQPLYTTPPQRTWVSLTDEEIYSLADSLEIWNEDDEKWILDPNTFARAIEAKLKEST